MSEPMAAGKKHGKGSGNRLVFLAGAPCLASIPTVPGDDSGMPFPSGERAFPPELKGEENGWQFIYASPPLS